MNRHLSKTNIDRLKNDFDFLILTVKKSYGELDLRLRGDYFNLYYKGNSLAKITFKKHYYEMSINKKFISNVFNKDPRFQKFDTSKDYQIFRMTDPKRLKAFFQRKYLNKLCRNIKKVNYGEEIVFEQMLITDNSNRNDLIIIDRQITETSLKRKRLDLLALRKIEGEKYGFLVIEVKLGNNKELKGEVVKQLQGYVNHIKRKEVFDNWKESYEKVYFQMRELGLIRGPALLKIIKNIKGIILVGQYSGLAKKNIERLRKKHPGLEIRRLVNLL
ncbi:MAG: hypothetical protein KAU58_04640 [Candidatus Omnitrophica bacterium]|nr:hypothetical protein [Candidatus Omnitrophota bacterium]